MIKGAITSWNDYSPERIKATCKDESNPSLHKSRCHRLCRMPPRAKSRCDHHQPHFTDGALGVTLALSKVPENRHLLTPGHAVLYFSLRLSIVAEYANTQNSFLQHPLFSLIKAKFYFYLYRKKL